jgi:hypothetical protein
VGLNSSVVLKGFQVLATNLLIARIPFFITSLRPLVRCRFWSGSSLASRPFLRLLSGIGLASLILALPQSSYSADTTAESERTIKLRVQLSRQKTNAKMAVKSLAAEQKTICRWEFSESLTNAFEKAKEQYRKLHLELTENIRLRSRTGD